MIIAIPALNEERVLAASVRSLSDFVVRALPSYDVRILVADNGSTDRTAEIGMELAKSRQNVSYKQISRRGKGLAIRDSWLGHEADVFAFMDADLSTDLDDLPALIGAVIGGADIAVGSRFHPGSVVVRGLGRSLVSRCYSMWVRIIFGTKVSDIPCGFKAASRRIVRDVVPQVEDNAWFFDSEFVIRAERLGALIEEVPVRWRDTGVNGRRSHVNVPKLAADYIRSTLRLRKQLS